ncbi:serine/threonine-protein kinase [Sorangium sp. So ce1014]|uniref:serine/threonine-protein kinase n=1 Tax=Sorangium sp. So ce1014 TaxID=3133326 RepID=UPI003F60C5BB
MTNAEDLPGPGALFQGRFLIDRLLGRGGMGEVWAALDTALERPVAIKIVHRALAGEARYAERFLRETKLVARVAHPNLVRLYDAGATAAGQLFMVMERVSGVPLREMLAGGARLDVVRALHYAIQIADALSTAHEAELVHRDVKPENVLVSGGVHARLLDFGVAKDARGPGLTGQGSVVGTLRYMAPEQIAGRAVDGRADLYALGVVTYEMLAGAHPYAVLDGASGIRETEILAAHVHLSATPLPEVLPGCPEALWLAVARCLAKRPEERFARAAELAAALREVARAALPAESALEDASARQLLSEAEDAARGRAIRERGATPRGEGEDAATAVQLVAGLPVGEAAEAGAAADARSRLAMAQRFRVEPAWGLGGASAGKEIGTGGEAAAERWPTPAPQVEGGATGTEAAGEGSAAAAGVLGPSTEKWAGAVAAGPGEGTLASTEKWGGAAAAMAGMAPRERLARTEPWEQARAGVMAKSAASSRTSWGLVVALVLGLVVVLAVLVVALVRR